MATLQQHETSDLPETQHGRGTSFDNYHPARSIVIRRHQSHVPTKYLG